MQNFTLRIATKQDAAALAAIYAPYIDTPITFETTVPTDEEFGSRIEEILKQYPYLVCEENGALVGYAYAHRFRERAAYDWCVELSIYLKQGCGGRGMGKALYTALLELLRMQGILLAYGCIAQHNAASERLHASLGFQNLGVFEKSGYKCGRWMDIVWYEKVLGEFPDTPRSPVPFPALEEDAVRRVLQQP